MSFGRIVDVSRGLDRCRILKFEKLPDQDSKNLEQERSLKKRLRAPLFYMYHHKTDAAQLKFELSTEPSPGSLQ